MSLLVWLPLHESTANCGVLPIKFTDYGASKEAAGKLGQCHYLNGKTLAVPNFTALRTTSDFTVSCWVKFTSFPNNSNAYCVCLNNTASSTYKFILGIFSSDGKTASFRLNLGSSTGTLNLNTWYHLAISVSGTAGYMYINGELVKTVTGITQSDCTNLVIGGRSTNAAGTAFTGHGAPAYYNDIRIYDNCLSPREIKHIAQGLAWHCPMDTIINPNLITKMDPGGRATSLSSHSLLLDLSANADTYFYFNISPALELNKTYTLSFDVENFPTGGSWGWYLFKQGTSAYYYTINKDGHYAWTFTTTSSTMPEGYSLTKPIADDGGRGSYQLGKVKFSNFKLEAGSTDTPWIPPGVTPSTRVADCSGYGGHCINYGALSSNSSGRYAHSAEFSNGKYLRTDTMVTVGWTDFTMAAWVNPSQYAATGSSTDRQTIIIGGMYLTLANGIVSSYCYGKTTSYYNGKTKIPLNEWSHIAVTYDAAGNHKIYVNGKLDASYTGLTGACEDQAFHRKKEVGAETNGSSRQFTGKISDVRIYATALSEEDIQELYSVAGSYTQGGSLLIYDMDENPNVANIKYHQNKAIAADFSEIGYCGGMKTKVLSDGSAWARIHWLDLTKDKTVFANDAEVAFCDQPNRFSRMGLVDYFKGYEIPKGYQKLKYIESTGTQYIDTNYYWTTEEVKIIMDAYITSNAANQSLFGNEEKYSGGDRYFGIIPHGINGTFSMYVGSSGGIGSVSPGLETRFTLECATTTAKVFTAKLNGTQALSKTYTGTMMAYANTSSTDASRGKIYIFSNHNSGSGAAAIQNVGGMRLYSFKMYDGGKMVRDFIPAKRLSDGKIGLLDKVYNVFYTNPGADAFTSGGASTEADTATGQYEFMLTYPSMSATAYNRWSQINSPNGAYGSAEGLKKLSTSWSSHSNAITKSNSSGSATYSMNTAGNWWAPIGQKTLFNSTGIPAADGSTQTETELWVRIDTVPDLDKISMLDNKYIQAFEINEL